MSSLIAEDEDICEECLARYFWLFDVGYTK